MEGVQKLNENDDVDSKNSFDNLKLLNHMLKTKIKDGFFTYDEIDDWVIISVVRTNPHQMVGQYKPFITRGEWNKDEIKNIEPKIIIEQLLDESDRYVREQVNYPQLKTN